MKKKQFKELVKPLIKEVLLECLLEEGLLSNIISETLKGTGNLVEQKKNNLFEVRNVHRDTINEINESSYSNIKNLEPDTGRMTMYGQEIERFPGLDLNDPGASIDWVRPEHIRTWNKLK